MTTFNTPAAYERVRSSTYLPFTDNSVALQDSHDSSCWQVPGANHRIKMYNDTWQEYVPDFTIKTRGLEHPQLGEHRRSFGMVDPARESSVHVPTEGGLLVISACAHRRAERQAPSGRARMFRVMEKAHYNTDRTFPTIHPYCNIIPRLELWHRLFWCHVVETS